MYNAAYEMDMGKDVTAASMAKYTLQTALIEQCSANDGGYGYVKDYTIERLTATRGS